jgi:hypothetical protein
LTDAVPVVFYLDIIPHTECRFNLGIQGLESAMSKTGKLLAYLIIGSALLSSAVSVANGQARPFTPAELEGKTSEQVYKNIQVLQGTSAAELIPGMHVLKAALGVECEYCHGSDRSQDGIFAKEMSRKMYKMMTAINETSFGDHQQVTCFTCHRGSVIPATTPGLPVLKDPSRSENSGSKLPTIEEILAKYVQALGGEEAIKAVKSRVITATQDVLPAAGKGPSVVANVDFYSKAPNLKLTVYHIQDGVTAEGFDGKAAWMQDSKGTVSELLKIDQRRIERSAKFYESLNLATEYESLVVTGKEKVREHEAYVVVGYSPDGSPEKLYFDVQTGLLLRKSGILTTPFGDSPFEANYEDYRTVGDGVKVPFLIQLYPATPRRELASHSTIRVKEVHDNVHLDNAKFLEPKSGTGLSR